VNRALQGLKQGNRSTCVNGGEGLHTPLAECSGTTRRDQRETGIHDHRVPRSTTHTGKNLRGQARILWGASTAELFD
jgi:hypothetical protein